MKLQKATFAAGCFWGVEASFRQIEGVVSAISGYTGGFVDNPSYEEVCSSGTGHAEAVELEYDPDKTSYEDLLDAFWKMHDPTSLYRQGADVGKQYRSAIFYHNSEQEAAARKSRDRLENSGRYDNTIVTEIVPASDFYAAEDYHQRYYEKRGLIPIFSGKK